MSSVLNTVFFNSNKSSDVNHKLCFNPLYLVHTQQFFIGNRVPLCKAKYCPCQIVPYTCKKRCILIDQAPTRQYILIILIKNQFHNSITQKSVLFLYLDLLLILQKKTYLIYWLHDCYPTIVPLKAAVRTRVKHNMFNSCGFPKTLSNAKY